MNTKEFLDKLRFLVVEYDRNNRSYPEHEFEGLAFYQDSLYTLGIEDDSDMIINNNPDIYRNKSG